MTEYVIKNGKAYPIVKGGKSIKTAKKPNGFKENINQLVKLLSKNGKTPVKVLNQKTTTYTKKNGKTIPALKVGLSNGREYMVTQSRFWNPNK